MEKVPTVEVKGCREAHARLATAVADLTDDVARRPSTLPGWTIAHVLTHLARNAEAMCRRIDAAVRDELVEQYVGGIHGRAAEIEAGATRSADELASDATRWSKELDERFGSLPSDCWDRPVRTVRGDEHPVALLPFRRWREVEVHLVDLGVGFTPHDWPDELVRLALPRLLASVPDRADHRCLMAWLLGRGVAPTLETWD